MRDATQIALDDDGGCAVVSGQVMCWGSNHQGLRGLGHDQPVAAVASRVPGLEGVVDLDVGKTFACALSSDGRLRCWGDLAGDDHNKPVAPTDMGITDALGVTCVGYGYCVRTRSGVGACASRAGQPTVSIWPSDVTDVVAPIGSTHRGSCAVLGNGSVRCSGELATADIVPLVEALQRPRSLAIGDGHACALGADSSVVCVGDDSAGQLATGKLLFATEPVLVP